MGFVPPSPTTPRYLRGGLFSSNTKGTKCADPSLDVGGAVGLGPGRGTGLSHSWRNGNASQPCSLRLISQSLVIEVWEGTRDRILDLGQNFQHLHLSGLSISSRAPQELVARRITIGHLAVVEVPLLHQIFSDELSGLPKDGVLQHTVVPAPRAHSTHTHVWFFHWKTLIILLPMSYPPGRVLDPRGTFTGFLSLCTAYFRGIILL